MVSSLSMRGGVKFSSPMAGAMNLLLGRTTQTGQASELKLAEASIGLVLRRGAQNISLKEFNEILKTGIWMEWISTTWTQLQQQFGVEATRIQALVAPMLWRSL